MMNTDTAAKENYLNTEQTAKLIGIRKRTLDRWRFVGQGPVFLKLGGRVLYRESDVHAWAASKAVHPEADMAEGM